jgi:hypothetical protein
MDDFFWDCGRLGWGAFSVLVFSMLWFLAGDLVWRLCNVRIGRLALSMAIGWTAGAGAIVLAVFLAER